MERVVAYRPETPVRETAHFHQADRPLLGSVPIGRYASAHLSGDEERCSREQRPATQIHACLRAGAFDDPSLSRGPVVGRPRRRAAMATLFCTSVTAGIAQTIS